MWARFRHARGVTLIELIAVAVVLGVLAMIIIPNVTNSINQSKTAAFQASLSELQTAADAYYAQTGAYPTVNQPNAQVGPPGMDISAYAQLAPLHSMTSAGATPNWVTTYPSNDPTIYGLRPGASGAPTAWGAGDLGSPSLWPIGGWHTASGASDLLWSDLVTGTFTGATPVTYTVTVTGVSGDTVRYAVSGSDGCSQTGLSTTVSTSGSANTNNFTINDGGIASLTLYGPGSTAYSVGQTATVTMDPAGAIYFGVTPAGVVFATQSQPLNGYGGWDVSATTPLDGYYTAANP